MTPKEKARELVLKFGEHTVQESWQSKNYFAIECALIAVDEIINCTPSVDIYPPNFQSIHSGVREYWIKVKQEIEKL